MSRRFASRKIHGGSDARVRMTVDMIELCMEVCLEGIRSSEPSANESELLERLRSRMAAIDRH